jgi:hypothetical protein
MFGSDSGARRTRIFSLFSRCFLNGLPWRVFALSALILSSCTTARINHFKEFAQAGGQYADTVSVVYAQAGDAAIDADSLVLTKTRSTIVSAREGLTGDALKQQAAKDSKQLFDDLNEHNRLLKSRLEILSDLQKHLSLLKNYFVALSALAASQEPSGIGEAAKGTVDALGGISARIKKAKVGELPVGDFVQPVTTIVVSQFQRAALEKELNARSVVIANEIDLQKAALTAIARGMRDDLSSIEEAEQRGAVMAPYSSPANALPDDWAATRKEFLKRTVKLDAVETAALAADRLKTSFIALVENRFDLADAEALVQDINRVATIIEGVQKPQK